MKIHSDIITTQDVWEAVRPLIGVYAEFTEHGSRSHTRAINVTLSGTSNRRQNKRDSDADKAATWDEWGIVIAALYQIDPDAVWGTVKNPVYANEHDFGLKTGYRFEELKHEDQHKNHNFVFSGIPRELVCKCGAVRRW